MLRFRIVVTCVTSGYKWAFLLNLSLSLTPRPTVGGMDSHTEGATQPPAYLAVETRCVGTFALAKGLKIYQGEQLTIIPDGSFASGGWGWVLCERAADHSHPCVSLSTHYLQAR
jgi:hypothetical protein